MSPRVSELSTLAFSALSPSRSPGNASRSSLTAA
jgi:hypothetical protein